MTAKQLRDFVDNTSSYKGKTVTMRLEYHAEGNLTQEGIDSIANTIVQLFRHRSSGLMRISAQMRFEHAHNSIQRDDCVKQHDDTSLCRFRVVGFCSNPV